ncbi:hypothetical protein C5167_012133 [Papaver somniferum]|uniref:Uncharacterized protein n=1 Tax=Papaver somniferum TaxID=3469 RepID=A0A4Y7IYL6_PAPSO|nr:hypothetical protein C5167_012133 [Papaver somniferum]
MELMFMSSGLKKHGLKLTVGRSLLPRLRMKKEVVVGVQDFTRVDNDFFLVVVKILDHRAHAKEQGMYHQKLRMQMQRKRRP